MSAKTRRETFAKKPGVRKAAVKRMQAVRARHKAEAEAQDVVSAVLEYQRGVRHGLEAARAIVYGFNGGRSWSSLEIANVLTDLTKDIPATVVVIGDALFLDEVPCSANIYDAFWKPRSRR